ncbi:Gfo/Idh/MocA family protein [[Lactobacillus] timonensis]|uniref:Gfo/Idh/MocA family protein n=1 Tax=[Lactobacillus] timonensis TaxID=1970790 RepID=UPI000C854D6E|nr:Gfo/Idh/MocA family oxidoreductase [[Lactobacillus] timonensis]
MLKLGIIGTHIITDQLLDAANKSGQYQLTTVYSRNMKRAEEFGKPYGATAFYDSLEKFFSEGDFDVVYIASPNSIHYQQVRLAIENDKFVILEKPALVNPHEFQEINKLLTAHPKARLFEAARNIHTPLFKAVVKKISQMKFGGATMNIMKYSSRIDKVYEDVQPIPNIFNPEFAGGALEDLGVYGVYLAVALYGKPDSVNYLPTMLKTGVDGNGVATLTYGERSVTIVVGKTSNNYLGTEFYGGRDTVWLDSAFNLRQGIYYDDQKQGHKFDVEVADNDMIYELQDFAEIINNLKDADKEAQYQRWLQLAEDVNKVIYDLRQSCDLIFPADTNY